MQGSSHQLLLMALVAAAKAMAPLAAMCKTAAQGVKGKIAERDASAARRYEHAMLARQQPSLQLQLQSCTSAFPS